MAYINLPPSLQALIDAIFQRLTKLENGQRFTAPNVPVLTTQPTVTGLLSTDPQQPRVGDVWLNTTINTLRYVDTTGAAQAMGSGGGSGTVTSITAGTGLSASPSSPITTSGTLSVTEAALNPTGSVIMYAGTGTPTDWLLCDGTAVSRTTYATLFGVIGTTYGVGNGTTTFNLPNMTSKFPRGATSPSTGGGSDTHTHTLSDSGYAKIRRANNRIALDEVAATTYTTDQEVTGTGSASSLSSTTGAGLGGSTDSGTAIPAYVAFRFIIKT